MGPTKSPKSKSPQAKALTIRQPWAELILRGRKPFELRSWKTKYRGPLVIHAAMKIDAEDARQLGLNPQKLITSAFVGVAILSDVRPYTREDANLLKKRRSEEHTSELQSRGHLVCRLLLEKKKKEI